MPAEKCALASAADGPVYVITPDALLYARLPSPPASVTEISSFTSASVLSVKLISPVDELYERSPPAEICALASAADGPVYSITPDALLYVRLPSPPLSVTDTDCLALACVKY